MWALSKGTPRLGTKSCHQHLLQHQPRGLQMALIPMPRCIVLNQNGRWGSSPRHSKSELFNRQHRRSQPPKDDQWTFSVLNDTSAILRTESLRPFLQDPRPIPLVDWHLSKTFVHCVLLSACRWCGSWKSPAARGGVPRYVRTSCRHVHGDTIILKIEYMTI